MRATGIIRRADDLGRVVIPREVRETLNISCGEALEIFTDEDCVIFKKYHITPIKDEIEFLKKHIQDYYECNDIFTLKQINEFKDTLSTIQKAFKDKE